MPTVTFSHDPPVSPQEIARWQADLETVVPRTDRVPWLKIIWQAGMDYEPVQRFELYEMVPLHPEINWIPDGILDALQGPNPRTVGCWYKGEDGVTRWISDSLVSLMQWELYRETNCWGRRWWIIQGDNGGHRLSWGPIERGFWQAKHGDAVQLPAPGSLAYAPYDNRVKEQVIRADRMREWRNALAWDERARTKSGAAKYVAQHRDALARQLNETMLQFLDEQVKAATSEVSQKELDRYMDTAPLDTQFDRKYEQLEQHILQGA